MGRAPCCDKENVKRGPWSPEEDAKLKNYIEKNGTGGNWIALPQKAGLRRCGKSCRLRWLNYLRPNIKHGDFSDYEDWVISTLYANIGSRWSIISAQLPGRTDNDIKNYWNTKLKKKLTALLPPPPLNTFQRYSSTINNNQLHPPSSFLTPSPYLDLHNNLPLTTCTTSAHQTRQMISCFENKTVVQQQQQQQHYQMSKSSLLYGGGEGSCSSSEGSLVNNNYKVKDDIGGVTDRDGTVLIEDYYPSSYHGMENLLEPGYAFEENKELISTGNKSCCSNTNFLINETEAEEEGVFLFY